MPSGAPGEEPDGAEADGSQGWELRLVMVVTDPASGSAFPLGPAADVPAWRLVGSWSPVAVTVLGDGLRYHEGLKAHLYHRYLQSLDERILSSTVFMFLDAHDIVLNGAHLTAEVVLRKYFRLTQRVANASSAAAARELPVILAAEANCWVGARRRGLQRAADASSAQDVGHCTAEEERLLASPSAPSGSGRHPLRYPNSGAVIGPGSQLLRLLDSVRKDIFTDDQFLLAKALARARESAAAVARAGRREAPLVAIDEDEDLFGSLLDLTEHRAQQAAPEGEVCGLSCGPPPLVRSCCARGAVSADWLRSFEAKRRGKRCALQRRGEGWRIAPLLWHGHGPGKALVVAVAQALLACTGSAGHRASLPPFDVEYWPFRLSCSSLDCPSLAEDVRSPRSREPIWRIEGAS